MTRDPDINNPVGYSQLLAQIKAEVRAGRVRAARAVNTEVIELYFRTSSVFAARAARRRVVRTSAPIRPTRSP